MQKGEFQHNVLVWTQACFGPQISADVSERTHRFFEEAAELAQAAGCTADEAHRLVDYVFDRPKGDIAQEVGGVLLTLAALCTSLDLLMHCAGEQELTRVWAKLPRIRAKQAAKPQNSPLPA